MSPRSRGYSIVGVAVDILLIFLTQGIWLLWILVRYLRSNTK